MISDGEYTAVVDRFEEHRAVLVIEDEGEAVDAIDVHRTWLPPDAREQDAVLTITVADGRPVRVRHDPAETESRKERAQRRFDSLANRPPEAGEGDGENGGNGEDGGSEESREGNGDE